MNFGLVGCGLIGLKRALNLGQHQLVAAFDTNADVLQSFCNHEEISCEAANAWEAMIHRDDIDAIIIATTHDALAVIATEAVRAGKHVLIEKPGARNASELIPCRELAAEMGRVVRVGFNHRFHPAFLKAKALVASETFGPLMYIRARYGHGGRIGYNKEWRADPVKSGGGELIDQGVHLVDLCRWLNDGYDDVRGTLINAFWEMSVEDNSFIELSSKSGQVAWLQASWTEWKNLFSFEIFCRDAKIAIEGLGGSYGTETLIQYKMKPEMGPPDIETEVFDGPDGSWQRELDAFIEAVDGKETACATLDDTITSLGLIDKLRAENEVRFLR